MRPWDRAATALWPRQPRSAPCFATAPSAGWRSAGWRPTPARTPSSSITLVVAYEAGGALAAGLLGVVRAVPPALIAPLAGVPSARWRPDRVLVAVNLGRTISMGLTAVVLATGGPLPLVFLLVGVEAGFGGLTRPLTMSLLPWVARSPGELVAANIASSAAEGVGTLIGPAAAGIVLATSGPIGASAATAVMMAVAVVATVSIRVPTVKTARATPGAGSALTAGVRAAAADLGGPLGPHATPGSRPPCAACSTSCWWSRRSIGSGSATRASGRSTPPSARAGSSAPSSR